MEGYLVMARTKGSGKNLCVKHYPIMSKTPCPLFITAYEKGLDGMSKCEIYDAVTDLIEDAKSGRGQRKKDKEAV